MITIVTDNGLHNHARERSGQPEQREMLYISAKCRQDPGGISILQCKTKLNSQEAKAHIPYLPELKPGFYIGSCRNNFAHAETVIYAQIVYGNISIIQN